MAAGDIVKSVEDLMKDFGFEAHPFKIGWYNNHVAEKFTFPYEYDTLAVLIISTPDMFDKALIPFMVRTECPGTGDLIDHCVSEYFKQIKEKFSEIDVEAIHDFELLPSRRPKVLVQTAGHVAGAAYYYQRADVQPDPWDQSQKIFGVSIHPKYGGWFALRGVLIFKGVKCPDLEKKEPVDIVPTYELRKDLLERFNFHWQDWTYRDIVPTVKKYSKDQMEYFSTPPNDRKGVVERLKQEAQSQVTTKG